MEINETPDNLPALNDNFKRMGFTSDQVIEMISLFLKKSALEKTIEGENSLLYSFRHFYNKNTGKMDLVIQCFATKINDDKTVTLVRSTRKPIVLSKLANEMRPVVQTNRWDKIADYLIKTFVDE